MSPLAGLLQELESVTSFRFASCSGLSMSKFVVPLVYNGVTQFVLDVDSDKPECFDFAGQLRLPEIAVSIRLMDLESQNLFTALKVLGIAVVILTPVPFLPERSHCRRRHLWRLSRQFLCTSVASGMQVLFCTDGSTTSYRRRT